MVKNRDYTFLELTGGLCSLPRNEGGDLCLKVVPAKIVSRDDKVFLHKKCEEHGQQEVLVSTDLKYYLSRKNFLKPGEMTNHIDTPVKYGCPMDCGLCSDHQQHSCISIVEITDNCNLTCPTCYAESAPGLKHRSLETVVKMLDSVVEHEGEPDIVQISGGEPTIHPKFFEILDEAKKRPIRYLLINTNGIKIATDPEFVEKLTKYMPDLGIYLQFDSFRSESLKKIRGADLREIRARAIEKLNEINLSTELVSTLQKGINVDEIGKTIEYGLQQKCVRGVAFQPIQYAGRTEGVNPALERLTLSEVRQEIIQQTRSFRQAKVFTLEDLVPIPCNPGSLFTGFVFKMNGDVYSLSQLLKESNRADLTPEKLIMLGSRSTVAFQQDPELLKALYKVFTTSNTPEKTENGFKKIFCCFPGVSVFLKGRELAYDNTFRVTGVRFMDAYDLDINEVKRSCVHIMTEQGRAIPFDTMNIFYRTDKQRARLAELQSNNRGFW